MRPVLPLGSLALAAALLLGGCGLVPGAPAIPTPAPPEQTDTPTTGAPAGWEALPHCEDAPDVPWVWVDGFPAAEFDASRAVPDCGDVWPQADGETFVGIASYEISTAQLNEFGAALEASGYEKLFDDFVPGTPSGETYYGARDYYLYGVFEGAFTRLAVEIYPSHVNPEQWTAFIDYLSPETRLLG